MEFRVLGALEVVREGELVPVRAGKQRVILAGLLFRAGQVVSIAELTDWLWGNAPVAQPRDTVYQYVMRLRQTLGYPDLIRTEPDGYRMVIEHGCVDLRRFDDLIARARKLAAKGDLVAELVVLSEALTLWRGPALMDVPSDVLRQTEGVPLAEARLRAVERRLDICLQLDCHDEVIGELTTLTRMHPWRERLWQQLILALVRSGRQAEALNAYHSVASLLRETLGVDPGPQLQSLHQAILSGDATVQPLPMVDPDLCHTHSFRGNTDWT